MSRLIAISINHLLLLPVAQEHGEEIMTLAEYRAVEDKEDTSDESEYFNFGAMPDHSSAGELDDRVT